MKSQLSLETIITLSLFILILEMVLLRLLSIVQGYYEVNERNSILLDTVWKSEKVVNDWIITNFSCPDFYVKIDNITCGFPGNTLVERYALCNGSICKVSVG